jgi:protein-S-isoprenylcysteine O-methyltransferase Ste14
MNWKRYAETAARMRVPSGFGLLAVYVVCARPATVSVAVGAAVALLGILLRACAAGHLEKNQRLATSGPYAYTRNPLYLGSALVALGFAIAARVWWLGLSFAAYLAVVYLPVVWEEEARLAELFPEFSRYAAAVPRFWPAGGRGAAAVYSGASTGFRWALYWKNQEYNASLGYLFGLIVLLWKML